MAAILRRAGLIPSFDHLHYVAVLYARGAEFTAVTNVSSDDRSEFTPLWVIPPIPTDARSGAPKKSLGAHVSDIADKLATDWGTGPAFFDVHQLRNEHDATGAPAARTVLETLASAGLAVIPVIRSDAPLLEVEALASFAEHHDVEVAARIAAEVWAELGSPSGDAALQDFVNLTRVHVGDIHLILDLQDQVSDPPNISAAAVRGALAELDRIDEWRSLTVLGTSMPATTSEVGRDSAAEISRWEWSVWKILKDSKRRRPSFGDYAIQSVDSLSTYNPLFMQTSAQLRYTIHTSWFVVRGRSTKSDAGFAQAHSLAAQIVGHSEYSGASFSAGDQWIFDCATRSVKSGNATTWRQATTNHHLVFVLRQLANLRGL